MKAVLIGGSGLVGSHLVTELKTKFDEVVSVSRRPLNVPDVRDLIVGDLDQLDQHASELRGDAYFCCLGTTIAKAGSAAKFRKIDYDAIVKFGEIAKAAGAKVFVVVSSKGASSRSKLFYSRVKGQTEEALKALKLSALVIYQPGLLAGKRNEFRPLEAVLENTLVPLTKLFSRKTRARFITGAEDLALHMVKSGLDHRPRLEIIDAKEIY